LETSKAAADNDYSMGFLFCGHDCHSATEPASSHRRDRQCAHPRARPIIIIPAFVRGVGSRAVHIDNVVDRRTRKHLGSHQLAELIGQQVELTYSRIDADGSLRKVRINAVDVSHA
jgi:hypothetical protein